MKTRRLGKTKRRTMLRCWPTPRLTPTAASVPIASHCKPCVANLDIAMINKFYDLATMQPEVPATVQSHYELLEKTASACIDCHACESRCPFGVKIAERMKKTAELFGC